MSNKIYNASKWGITVVLPALGALYFGLGQIWGFPYVEQVIGTIAVVGTFGGTLLGISSIQYAKKQ